MLAEKYHGEALLDLAHLPVLMRGSLVDVSPSQRGTPDSSFALPDWVVVPHQWYYDDTILLPAVDAELAQWDNEWRAREGSPRVVLYTSEMGVRRFRLVPLPTIPTHDFIFILGDPLGRHYPSYAVCIVHTEVRDDYPDWLNYPLAWSILAREFSRESNHKDLDFAAACAMMAEATMRMVQ